MNATFDDAFFCFVYIWKKKKVYKFCTMHFFFQLDLRQISMPEFRDDEWETLLHDIGYTYRPPKDHLWKWNLYTLKLLLNKRDVLITFLGPVNAGEKGALLPFFININK